MNKMRLSGVKLRVALCAGVAALALTWAANVRAEDNKVEEDATEFDNCSHWSEDLICEEDIAPKMPVRTPSCPSQNFEAFLPKFMDDVAYQKHFTQFPLETDTDEKGPRQTERRDDKDMWYPLLPDPLEARRSKVKYTISKISDDEVEVSFTGPGADGEAKYHFAKNACWNLTKVEGVHWRKLQKPGTEWLATFFPSMTECAPQDLYLKLRYSEKMEEPDKLIGYKSVYTYKDKKSGKSIKIDRFMEKRGYLTPYIGKVSGDATYRIREVFFGMDAFVFGFEGTSTVKDEGTFYSYGIWISSTKKDLLSAIKKYSSRGVPVAREKENLQINVATIDRVRDGISIFECIK